MSDCICQAGCCDMDSNSCGCQSGTIGGMTKEERKKLLTEYIRDLREELEAAEAALEELGEECRFE